jgi:hypothetical protein
MNNKIYAFWWSCQKLEGKPFENFGDILAAYIANKLSGKEVIWADPRQQPWYSLKHINLITGSIIKYATPKSNVWGVGILSVKDSIRSKRIYAVRGPETIKRLHQLGLSVNPPVGDPALLLPRIYTPKAVKKYRLGIIPHYTDVSTFIKRYQNQSDILVVDMRKEIEEVIEDIASCETTWSSSLHGLIVSHAYGIPSIRFETHTRISGDGIKYADYFGSVGIEYYEPFQLEALEAKAQDQQFGHKIRKQAVIQTNLDQLSDNLVNTCPFLS